MPTRPPPRSPRPNVRPQGEVPVGDVHGAWECDHCHTFTTTKKWKCNNCGAPRPSEARCMLDEPKRFVDPSFVTEPADRVEPDPALYEVIEK